MFDLWEEVRTCFDTDDGSLPGIEVANLSPTGLSAVYALLRGRSQPYGPAEFWSRIRNESLPIDSVADAAGLVAAGEADAFHFGVAALVANGVELPQLGVFVFL